MPEPEARFDPLGRRWVMLAPDRANRGAPDPVAPDEEAGPCDFCAGREDRTPPQTYAVTDEEGRWVVRAFPNLYPGTPFHEVVVHGPDHDTDIERLPPEHRLQILLAYRDRIAASGRSCTIAAFNRGREAGASRSHEHSQVFGVDVVPPVLQRETEAFRDDPCVLCGLVDDVHHVSTHGEVRLAVHPAPIAPREILVVPPCAQRLEEASTDVLRDAGNAIADALRRLRVLYGSRVPLNLVLHTAPDGAEGFHWHAHLIPRMFVPGALELGAELPLVAADPAADAAALRDA
ncbi:MAG TPA: hypothetical protein VM840_06470 [Actinomycetota bacterium]|nr:hypothetical protein [Actinomycetota bacterium]